MLESFGLSLAHVNLLNAITSALSKVPGVVAVVLGGSYARRTARPDSNLDLGLYYSENSPPDVEAIRRCAETISAPNTPPTVVGYYQWGPWVNGGAWIRTPLGSLCLRLTLNTFLVTKAVSKPSIAFRCVPVISPIGSENYWHCRYGRNST